MSGLVILDEIQTRPDLFPLLRVLADREGLLARFLILGSAAPEPDAAMLISGGCIPALKRDYRPARPQSGICEVDAVNWVGVGKNIKMLVIAKNEEGKKGVSPEFPKASYKFASHPLSLSLLLSTCW